MAITMLAGYLVIINAAALLMMAEDKRRAKRHQWRVPEAALFGAALLGGSAGAWAGMYLFHHKTKHWYFVVGMPLILAAQLAAGVWLAGTCPAGGYPDPAVLCPRCAGQNARDTALKQSTPEQNDIIKGITAQFPPNGSSTAPAAAARHLRCQNTR